MKSFYFQLKHSNREKLDAKLRLDRLDIQKENLRLERDMLKKDLNEANSEKSGLQVNKKKFLRGFSLKTSRKFEDFLTSLHPNMNVLLRPSS